MRTKPQQTWQKEQNRPFVIQGQWDCYPGSPDCKELQVDVIFLTSSTATQAHFLSVLLHHIIIINYSNKLLRKPIYCIYTFLPNRGFQKLPQLRENKPQKGSWSHLKTKHHHPRKPPISSKSKPLDTSRCLVISLLVSVAHRKSLRCCYDEPPFEGNSQHKSKDSRERKMRKENLHFKYWQKALAPFIWKLYHCSAYGSIRLYNV